MLTKNYEKLAAEVQAHIAADAVVQGHYWADSDNAVSGSGCWIGCLAHGEDLSLIEETYGLPKVLIRVCENIFEDLPSVDAKKFFADFPEAVGRDGKDLSKVVLAFLASELRAFSIISEITQKIIDGLDLLAAGKEWEDIKRDAAAADVAYHDATDIAAAYPAAYAAYSAEYAAAYAAADDDVAYDAYESAEEVAYVSYAAYAAAADDADYAAACAGVRKKQAATLLKLISEA